MNPDFEHKLDKYAEIIVNVGLNLQPGQRLMIGVPSAMTPLETAPLVRRVTARAYDAGARLVTVLWEDEELRRIRLEHAALDTLDIFPQHLVDVALDHVRNADARLIIHAGDPDLFNGIDPQRTEAEARAMLKALKPVIDLNASYVTNWLVIGYPVASWAAKVFPGLPAAEQIERMWQAVFQACRVDQPDPAQAWRRHVRAIEARSAALNNRQYAGLHYTAPGTDLTVGLPKHHVWEGGGTRNKNGLFFIPNFPTEEVFTLPHREQADGTVRATRPFTFLGSRIEGASLTFSNGRVVDYRGEKGRETLRNLLETDEGASRLGEAALVPNSSPISQTGLMFYNELYDENAACHLALGRAYSTSLQGGGELSPDAFKAAGGNLSDVHNDFMIGSAELDIDGLCDDGSREPIMRQGEWVFEVEA